MTFILVGYDIGVIRGASEFMENDLQISDVQMEVLAGIANLYYLVGMAVGRTSDWIGRRYTVLLASVSFFLGALNMGFATNYAFLMVGSFLNTIGASYALMIAPVYAGEVSPALSRGFLASFPEVFMSAGILLGSVSGYAFSKLPTNINWRLMLGICSIPSVFLAIGVLAMPESPGWLVMQGQLGLAKRVIDKTSNTKQEADLRLADIKAAAGIPENCTDDVVSVPKKGAWRHWRELLIRPTPTIRRILITACGIQFFREASGHKAVDLYSPMIFQKAGIRKEKARLLSTIAMGFIEIFFTFIAAYLVDKVGRRPLLLISVGGMIFSLAALGMGFTVNSHSNTEVEWGIGLCLWAIISYNAFFSMGMGPIPWVYSSEIFPLGLRAQGCSIGVAVNRVTSGILSLIFISLVDAITMGGAFFGFTGVAMAAWVFFYKFLPETQGKTLEEIETLFEDSNQKAAESSSSTREIHRNDSNNPC